MFVTTLFIVIGVLLPDPALSCRSVTTATGYDFARVHIGECVTLATEDGSAAAYVITEIRVTQVLGVDDGFGAFAFDAVQVDEAAGAMLYKLIERHSLTPRQSGIPLQAV